MSEVKGKNEEEAIILPEAEEPIRVEVTGEQFFVGVATLAVASAMIMGSFFFFKSRAERRRIETLVGSLERIVTVAAKTLKG